MFLERIYIDNFRSLVNFELALGMRQVFLGGNGSGKSSVLDALWMLRELVIGERSAAQLWQVGSLTRWDKRRLQVFELGVNDGNESYLYRVEISHESEHRPCEIVSEKLTLGGKPLFVFEDGEAQLCSDRGTMGPKLLMDARRSGLAAVFERHDNKKLTQFKRQLAKTWVVRMAPKAMSERSDSESTNPSLELDNYAAWYRHLVQERQNEMVELRDILRGVMPGFDSMSSAAPGGDSMSRTLKTRWTYSGTSFDLGFDELSDGQRALVALYTLLFAFDEGVTLFIDEPENYVTLSEIQPWLNALSERDNIQALLVSHHPEVIDQLSKEHGLVFSRREEGPVRVQRHSQAGSGGRFGSGIATCS